MRAAPIVLETRGSRPAVILALDPAFVTWRQLALLRAQALIVSLSLSRADHITRYRASLCLVLSLFFFFFPILSHALSVGVEDVQRCLDFFSKPK